MSWTKAKNAIVGAVVLLLVLGSTTAVFYPALAKKAPDLQGAWEGALEDNGRTLRLVLNIKKANTAYSATLTSIEQGARDIPVSEVTYSNTTVHLSIKSANTDFRGEINASGSEIDGTWQQFGATYSLTLKRSDKPSSLAPSLPMSAYVPRAGSDLQGYWIGDLPAGEARLVRIALKITEPTNGTFIGAFDLVDRGLKDFPIASIIYEKPHLTFDMAASKAHFEGEIDLKTKEISGQWREWRGKPVPLVFSRADPKDDEIKIGSFAYTSEDEPQGFWVGTLNLPRTELQLMLKISKLDDGAFASTLDSIDQGAKNIPTTNVRCMNSQVHLEWRGLGATYDGRIEKGRLLGTWQQGNSSMQLDFVRTNQP